MQSAPTASAGYFRMPSQWLRLPVSPGAKVLLAHFCAAADEDGRSYYSFQQLTEIVDRSKAAISGYVDELRKAGVLRTKQQKTASGHNYRLLVIINNWSDILNGWRSRRAVAGKTRAHSERAEPAHTAAASVENAELSADPSTPKTERGIQQAERKDPSGPTNIHKNSQPQPISIVATARTARRAEPQPEWSSFDEQEWLRFQPNPRDPISSLGDLPSPGLRRKIGELLEAAQNSIEERDGKRPTRPEVERRILDFCGRRRLRHETSQVNAIVERTLERLRSQRHLAVLIEHLESCWKPHWRSLSSPEQFRKMLEEIPFPDTPEIELIAKFQSRAWTYDLVARRAA